MADDWRELLEEINVTEEEDTGLPNYLETPVDLREFVESKDYCNAESLTEVQYYECERGIGEDTTKLWTRERVVRMLVYTWGLLNHGYQKEN